MSPKTRIWALLTALVCIVILALGIVGGLLPQLAAASGTFGLVGETQQRNGALRAQIDALKQQQDRLDEISQEVEELRSAIPDTAASSEWVRELAAIEQQSGATLTAFGVSTPAEPAAAPAEADSESADAAAEEDGAAAEDATGADAATTPVTVSSGVLTVPIQLTVKGSEEQITEFVRLLQTSKRLVTVQLVTQTATGDGWESTVTGAFYVSQG